MLEIEPHTEAEQAGYLANLAEKLTAGVQAFGRSAEIVRVPQRSFAPRDISKAAFAWRMLDLTESNARPIDLAICLDFPAWSLQHPYKTALLTTLPNFVVRGKLAQPTPKPNQIENAGSITALLQAERRGLAEAKRLQAATRPVAEELARRGLQVEYNPLPTNSNLPPTDQAWQTVIQRLLKD